MFLSLVGLDNISPGGFVFIQKGKGRGIAGSGNGQMYFLLGMHDRHDQEGNKQD